MASVFFLWVQLNSYQGRKSANKHIFNNITTLVFSFYVYSHLWLTTSVSVPFSLGLSGMLIPVYSDLLKQAQ